MKRRRPQLLPDWRDILRRAWSIRLMLLAGLLSGCEAILPLFSDSIPVPRWASSLIVLAVIAAAFVTRLLAQRQEDDDGP
jgi:hypothetical protein